MRLVAIVLAAACARGTPTPEPAGTPSTVAPPSVAPAPVTPPRADAALELTRLVPDTATIADGRVVVVYAIGRGFDLTDNVLEFGPAVFTRVRASATRDTITFTVPLEFQTAGGAPPTRVEPGEYSVTIRVGPARTASRTFRVLEPRGGGR